jgi:hypothetical protein
MKKLLAILVLSGITSTVVAQTSATVAYQQRSTDNGSSPDQYQTQLQVRQGLGNGFAIDFGIRAAQNDYSAKASQSFKDSTRVEAGVSYQQAVYGPIDGYLRLGLGQKAPSGTEAFWYGSEEIGVIGKLPYGFKAKVGYRWRQELFSGNASQVDTNETLRLGLSYDIDNKNTIGINRDKINQDAANGGNQTAHFVTYTRRF